MFRTVLFFLLLFLSVRLHGQPLAGDSTAALSFMRSLSVPMNSLKLFDQALEAWKWTFGQEPGAQLLRMDREAGVIEGTARVNFRSAMLTNREETMGTIRYRVIINIRAGECRTVVTELIHTGNRNAPGNGVDLGLLIRAVTPPGRVRGMGRGNATRVYAEIKQHASERIASLMQAFDSKVRFRAEP